VAAQPFMRPENRPEGVEKAGLALIEVLQEAGVQNVWFYCLAPMATL